MDQLAKLKDSILGYFSPKRTDPLLPNPKRRRTAGPGTPSRRISAEHAYQSLTEPRGENARAAVIHRITRYAPVGDAKNPLKRSRENEEFSEDDEGDKPTSVSLDGGLKVPLIYRMTRKYKELDEGEEDIKDEEGDPGLEEEDENIGMNPKEPGPDNESLSPEDSPSQITHNYEEEDEIDGNEVNGEGVDHEENEDGDDNEVEYEDELVNEESLARQKVQEYLARQAELALKKEAIAEVKLQGDWHPDEIFLFERLSLRSFEPIIPKKWKIDFKTLPDEIFHTDKDQVLINYNCSPSYHGVKNLQALIGLGVRIKELSGSGDLNSERCTKYIEKAILDCIKWTERDGGYFQKKYLPVLVVITGKPRHSTERISKEITELMQLRAKQHREYLLLSEPRTNELGEVKRYRRPPPLLYGIIVVRTIVIFVTLDSSCPEAKLRHIAHFDFKEPKVNVWNGFAVAIICVLARNYLMSIKDEFEEEIESTSDIDA